MTDYTLSEYEKDNFQTWVDDIVRKMKADAFPASMTAAMCVALGEGMLPDGISLRCTKSLIEAAIQELLNADE